jgi:hypothetical protein
LPGDERGFFPQLWHCGKHRDGGVGLIRGHRASLGVLLSARGWPRFPLR